MLDPRSFDGTSCSNCSSGGCTDTALTIGISKVCALKTQAIQIGGVNFGDVAVMGQLILNSSEGIKSLLICHEQEDIGTTIGRWC